MTITGSQQNRFNQFLDGLGDEMAEVLGSAANYEASIDAIQASVTQFVGSIDALAASTHAFQASVTQFVGSLENYRASCASLTSNYVPKTGVTSMTGGHLTDFSYAPYYPSVNAATTLEATYSYNAMIFADLSTASFAITLPDIRHSGAFNQTCQRLTIVLTNDITGLGANGSLYIMPSAASGTFETAVASICLNAQGHYVDLLAWVDAVSNPYWKVVSSEHA